MIRLFLAALCAVLFASNAGARPRHGHHSAIGIPMAGCSDPICEMFSVSPRPSAVHTAHRKRYRRTPSPGLRRVMAEGAGRVVGGRPAGCPRRYCGCGASLYLFGKIIPKLNLAANWFRFPRTSPAPGMVAVRRHHVFVLKRHIGGKVWHVFDANSGNGKTRLHNRSIAGFVIVDPRAGA